MLAALISCTLKRGCKVGLHGLTGLCCSHVMTRLHRAWLRKLSRRDDLLPLHLRIAPAFSDVRVSQTVLGDGIMGVQAILMDSTEVGVATWSP